MVCTALIAAVFSGFHCNHFHG